MQWMQYAVDAVHSGIVVYGGGDIVFGAKRSNQWMQYSVDAVKPVHAMDAVHSGIVVYGVGTFSLVQKGQISGRNGHSGRSGHIMQYAVE